MAPAPKNVKDAVGMSVADLSRVLDDAERWNAQGPSVDREGGFAAITRLRKTLDMLRKVQEAIPTGVSMRRPA